MANKTAYGTIRVAREGTDRFITLTFTSKKVYLSALDALDRLPGTTVEPFWGYSVYRTTEDAVEDAKFWLGLLPKAANF